MLREGYRSCHVHGGDIAYITQVIQPISLWWYSLYHAGDTAYITQVIQPISRWW